VILSINGTEIEDAYHMLKMENEAQGNLDIIVDRNGKKLSINIEPVKDPSDGKMRLGVWVRDNSAGVGTLTFIMPNDRKYGGLGHAICDLDTGNVLSVKEGKIFFSQVVQINKGESGVPGEIQGDFLNSPETMGTIEKNTDYGIYGKVFDNVDLGSFSQPIPAANRNEIRTGPAKILAMIDNEGVKSFDCEIIKINLQDEPGQKGLVLQITDEELLSKTGGIVQGMSGSPIIQNGKLIGAVTHVFVNNPTKGYGLFIDWMIEQLK
jgi:stage IV sporulation protein B